MAKKNRDDDEEMEDELDDFNDSVENEDIEDDDNDDSEDDSDSCGSILIDDDDDNLDILIEIDEEDLNFLDSEKVDKVDEENTDEIVFKKALINLQHLVGYEIQKEKFVDKEITKYSKLNFYDNDFDTLKMSDEINSYLRFIMSKSDVGIKQVVKEGLDYDKPEFIVNKITGNKYNNIISKSIRINNSYLMKFENFKWK